VSLLCLAQRRLKATRSIGLDERGLFLSENIFDNHEEMLPTKIDREVN
jgi:hypothetical protein